MACILGALESWKAGGTVLYVEADELEAILMSSDTPWAPMWWMGTCDTMPRELEAEVLLLIDFLARPLGSESNRFLAACLPGRYWALVAVGEDIFADRSRKALPFIAA